jgi:ribonuclease P protein component
VTHPNSFRREEHLKSRKLIAEVFDRGRQVRNKTFALHWLISPQPVSLVQVAFSVPVSQIRKAVIRNLIRRRMREAYRLNKHLLYSAAGRQGLLLVIVFRPNREMEFSDLQQALVAGLQTLVNDVAKSADAI